MKEKLTIPLLKKSAEEFCKAESKFKNRELYGITDGKAVGTYIEHKFQRYLSERYEYEMGSSAKGIDLPEDGIQSDIKVTSIRQPQSSCPFKDAQQKIFGLGYNLLIFVYKKTDIKHQQAASLDFMSCTFLEKNRTADYTTTFRLIEMVKDGAIKEDIIAYLVDRNIPVDETGLNIIASKIMAGGLEQGYLTISNALQWRLQYARIVTLTDDIQGISKLIDKVNK